MLIIGANTLIGAIPMRGKNDNSFGSGQARAQLLQESWYMRYFLQPVSVNHAQQKLRVMSSLPTSTRQYSVTLPFYSGGGAISNTIRYTLKSDHPVLPITLNIFLFIQPFKRPINEPLPLFT